MQNNCFWNLWYGWFFSVLCCIVMYQKLSLKEGKGSPDEYRTAVLFLRESRVVPIKRSMNRFHRTHNWVLTGDSLYSSEQRVPNEHIVSIRRRRRRRETRKYIYKWNNWEGQTTADCVTSNTTRRNFSVNAIRWRWMFIDGFPASFSLHYSRDVSSGAYLCYTMKLTIYLATKSFKLIILTKHCSLFNNAYSISKIQI